MGWEARLHAPVILENDANAAAVGEQIAGAGLGVNDLVYYTVSTGVGGGIIVDDKLISGIHGFAGELWHITVDPTDLVAIPALALGPIVEHEPWPRVDDYFQPITPVTELGRDPVRDRPAHRFCVAVRITQHFSNVNSTNDA